MTVRVLLEAEARADFDALAPTVKARVLAAFERLTRWPDVSGVKWLRREWSGHGRIRVGDWRVIFRIASPDVIVVRIKHRREVYDD
jgi:mRNA-degrading endonuclease RelE of RelBE toxin-antitoxin system